MVKMGPRTGVAGVLLSSAGAMLAPQAACAQSTAPSSITPPAGREATNTESPGVAIPASDGLAAPAGAEALQVTVAGIEVDGGYPALKRRSDAILAPFAGRRVTLAELYAAASAIEKLYGRDGYVMTRVVVPPQKVEEGGIFHIRVVSGFVGTVEVAPALGRAGPAVSQRLDPLIRREGMTLDQIERPVLLAGDVPGVVLTSTLARGDEVGSARLIIGGSYRPVTGSVTFDNGVAASLGGGSITAQLSLNSILGGGEQVYGFAILPIEVQRTFDADAPLRVFGGGAIIPVGDGRFALNPEVTFARTQPEAAPGVPRTVGRLERYSVGGTYTLTRLRRLTTSLSARIESIEETNQAIDFGVDISRDRFTVARIGANGLLRRTKGGLVSASLRFSQGLGGVTPASLPAGVGPSRTGATPEFSSLLATLRIAEPIVPGVDLRLIAKGQTTFGDPVFRSEQAALEGPDALSAYVGGRTAVDAMAAARVELVHTVVTGEAPRKIAMAPYLFGAYGAGRLEQPTTVERRAIELYNVGGGVRGQFGGTPLGYQLEYAHGFRSDGFRTVDRVSASVTLAF